MGGCNNDKPGWISAMRDVPSVPSITSCIFEGCSVDTVSSSWDHINLPHDMVLSPNFTSGPDTYQNSLQGTLDDGLAEWGQDLSMKRNLSHLF
jgi:hypothetical protein